MSEQRKIEAIEVYYEDGERIRISGYELEKIKAIEDVIDALDYVKDLVQKFNRITGAGQK